MNRTLIIVAGVALILTGLFFAFNSYIYNEKQQGPVVESYFGTLSGEKVCLPHKDTTGPQTLECAIGMKTDSGEYYALDTEAAVGVQNVQDGKRFIASGTITPIELLSSDYWQKYQVSGIFSIAGEVQIETMLPAQEEPVVAVPPKTEGKCFVGGCSSQLCTDNPDIMSTCEYREAYGCYKTATCERQSTGACGWTESAELKQCLAQAQ